VSVPSQSVILKWVTQKTTMQTRSTSDFDLRKKMSNTVSDEDIRNFIVRNLHEYPSQIALMQAAVKLLWPQEHRADGSKRVVRLCLEEFHTLPSC
jgi:hypothetical protein